MISQKFINTLSIVFVCVVLALSVIAFVAANYLGAVVLPEKNITDAAVRQLNLVTEMIKLIITLATGLIGVTVWLLTRPLTDEQELRTRVAWGGLSFLSLCLSLYFGFIALDGALSIVSASGGFDARANLVWWPQTLQYYAFIAGAFLLGLACLRSVNAIIRKD